MLAIKLKRFSTNVLIKILVFVLLLISVHIGMNSLISLMRPDRGQEDMINEYTRDFETSERLSKDLGHYARLFYELNYGYPPDNKMSQEDLEQKNEIREQLKEYPGFEMVIVPKSTKNNKNVAELTKTFERYPIYYIQKNGFRESNDDYLRYNLLLDGDDYYFVGINKVGYQSIKKNWNIERKQFVHILTSLVVSFIVAVICFAFLCIVIGKKSGYDGIYMGFLDQVFTELQLVVAVCSIYWLVYLYARSAVYPYQKYIIGTVGWTLFFQVLLLQVKRIRIHQFWDGFLIVRMLKKLKKALLAIWYGGPRILKAMLLAVLIPIISSTIWGAVLLIPILMLLAYRYVKNLEAVLDGVKKVKEGQLDYRIEVTQKGDLKELANDINSISEGLNNAVAAEVKSERLKSELLSNVSHDIKTPLTSVITYIHLLKGEEIANETASEYIEIIDRKSQRLKVLTTDLFEAAKATSGDMPVNMQPVDFNAFIRQGIGEFEDRIEGAGLEVRLSLTNDALTVLADGNLLWRVFQNIMSNVIKYAMPNSRIYVALTKTDKYVVLEVKNISAHELNIPAADLMERFQRGDKSRATEGSGLGLSIARSLIELQNGLFQINIDGDLFKVTIQLERDMNQV